MPRNPYFPIESSNLAHWTKMTLRELEDMQLKITEKLDKIDMRNSRGLKEEYLDVIEQLDNMITQKRKEQEKADQDEAFNQRRDERDR